MPLTNSECVALMELIEAMSPDQFSNILFKATHVKLTKFVGANANIGTISLECVGWLEANIHHAPALLKRLITAYPEHESAGALRAAANRLSKSRKVEQAQGPPNGRVLAGGVPVVNRGVLRAYLGELMSGNDLSVILVEGESGLGRSHSWNLIRCVGNSLRSVRPIEVDLVGPIISQQNLPKLFDYLVRVLRLPPGQTPTTEGIPCITQSERFLGEFVTRIQSMPSTWAKTPWLVFDHLDRNIAPEIKFFVMGLASLRLQGVFEGCVIFLLGPDPTVVLQDPAALARREPLSAFLDDEIIDAAARLNSVGKAQLNEAELRAKQGALMALRNGRSTREFITLVYNELVAMRQKVGAG
jgi:hypothetical protein